MDFLNEYHEKRYNRLVQKDNMHPKDSERISLFYILSGNEDLYKKSNQLYDFNDNRIIIDYTVDLSTGMSMLIDLAFNLFNNYKSNKTVLDIFSCLDDDNLELAMNALRLRLRR